MRGETSFELLINTIELRDPYTQGHSKRVAIYAKNIAKALCLSKEEIKDIYIAGYLHDIGKIAIPDAVLLKPGILSQDERDIINYHSELSGNLTASIKELEKFAPIVRAHHEFMDGSGYPDKLRGDEIPFFSRILAYADIWDALCTKRVYRNALDENEAIAIITEYAHDGKLDDALCKPAIEAIRQTRIFDERPHLGELEKLQQKRNTFFFEDSLTRLCNRDALFATLRQLSKSAIPVTLVCFDIHHFRLYNQKYGTARGDDTLCSIATALKSFSTQGTCTQAMRDAKYAFRVGSDEFALIYSGDAVVFFFSKLQEIMNRLAEKHGIGFRKTVLLEYEKIASNIEQRLGYYL